MTDQLPCSGVPVPQSKADPPIPTLMVSWHPLPQYLSAILSADWIEVSVPQPHWLPGPRANDPYPSVNHPIAWQSTSPPLFRQVDSALARALFAVVPLSTTATRSALA